MKLDEALEHYLDYSARVSEVTRNLSFAGIAVVWIFHSNDVPVPKVPVATVPEELLLPLCLFAISLGFDLLQNVFGTALWYIVFKGNEHKATDAEDNPDIAYPGCWVVLIHIAFWVKVSLVLVAYALLATFLYRAWR